MSLKRGIFYTFLTQVPTLLLYFVSNICLTRILGDEGRGAYALFMNQTALLTMALGLNLAFGINYFVSREQGNPARMVRVASTSLLFNLAALPLFLAMSFGIPALNRIFFPPGTGHWGYFLFLFATVMAAQVSGYIGAIVLAFRKFAILNRMSIFSAGLAAVGYGVLFALRANVPAQYALPAVLGIALACSVVTLVFWLWIYIRLVGLPPVPTWEWQVLKPVLSLSMVGYLSNMINLINYRFDIWVVGSYAGTAQLGLYAAAAGVVQMLFYIPEPFSKVVQPYLYSGLNPNLLERFKFISRLSFTSVTAISLLLALSAPWLIPLIYGSAFTEAVTPLILLLPGIIFVCAFKLFAPLVIEGGHIRFNLYATSVSAAITILLDLLLIPPYGIIGAAVASTLAYAALFAVQSFVIRFKMQVPMADMFLVQRNDLARMLALVKGRVPTLFRDHR